jgi:hypothetical protein
VTSDLDDTVLRPPQRAERVDQAAPDLDDTITLVRGERAVDAVVAVPEPPKLATAPIALVEPPRAGTVPPQTAAPRAAAPRNPSPPESAPEENVWAAPVPESPPPFRLRLDDGTVVPLDQPVYLGRKPSVPRVHPGGTPLLVTFDSPEREVSSTHLELTTVGGAIVAHDMKSTNGSVLHVPGAAPRTLIGGESAVVTPGSRIELGDGNTIELLAPERRDADPLTGDPR